MDFEFHYYITGIIAHRAGFTKEESTIIAHASQLVDDNSFIYTIKDRSTGKEYSNYISQTKNILKPGKTLMRIYSVFHFIPGNPMATSAKRKDGKIHVLNTTPNNNLAQKLMRKAFDSLIEKRLYRIGIASHGYVDTWAHQNFVGFNDSFNGFNFNPTPNIGHSDVILNPDKIGNSWVDSRLIKEKINNNERFILAAENLFYLYVDYLKSNALWEPLKKTLLHIMGKKKKKRMPIYSILAPWLPPYNKYYWLDKNTNQKICGFKDARGKFTSWFRIFKDKYYWKENIIRESTDWFKFQEAIKDHQADVLPLINDIYTIT